MKGCKSQNARRETAKAKDAKSQSRQKPHKPAKSRKSQNATCRRGGSTAILGFWVPYLTHIPICRCPTKSRTSELREMLQVALRPILLVEKFDLGPGIHRPTVSPCEWMRLNRLDVPPTCLGPLRHATLSPQPGAGDIREQGTFWDLGKEELAKARMTPDELRPGIREKWFPKRNIRKVGYQVPLPLDDTSF